MRVNKSEEGLALLHSPMMAYGEISLHREKGSWKVIQLLGSPLS
jgi:hypothetical protein